VYCQQGQPLIAKVQHPLPKMLLKEGHWRRMTRKVMQRIWHIFSAAVGQQARLTPLVSTAALRCNKLCSSSSSGIDA